MKKEQLKQKLESVASVLRTATALLVERNISTMTRDVLRDTIAEVDTIVGADLDDQAETMIKGTVTFTYSDGAKTAISLFQCLKGHYRVSNDGQILRPISYTLLLGPGTLTVAEAVRLSTWLNQIPLVISG